MKINEPMQRLLDLVEQLDREKPKPVQVPEKCIRELNQFGEIRSREEFLEFVRPNHEARPY